MEPICGRPKGMKFNPFDGLLYVADSYKGLMKINTTNGHTEIVLTGKKMQNKLNGFSL